MIEVGGRLIEGPAAEAGGNILATIGGTLHLFLRRPTIRPEDIAAVAGNPFEFALLALPSPALLFRCGEVLPWQMAGVGMWLDKEHGIIMEEALARVVPPDAQVLVDGCLYVAIYLVHAATGIVHANRLIRLDPDFTGALVGMLREQAARSPRTAEDWAREFVAWRAAHPSLESWLAVATARAMEAPAPDGARMLEVYLNLRWTPAGWVKQPDPVPISDAIRLSEADIAGAASALSATELQAYRDTAARAAPVAHRYDDAQAGMVRLRADRPGPGAAREAWVRDWQACRDELLASAEEVTPLLAELDAYRAKVDRLRGEAP